MSLATARLGEPILTLRPKGIPESVLSLALHCSIAWGRRGLSILAHAVAAPVLCASCITDIAIGVTTGTDTSTPAMTGVGLYLMMFVWITPHLVR